MKQETLIVMLGIPVVYGGEEVKDDMASMEHPVFSLITHIDKRVLHYQHNGNSIRIIAFCRKKGPGP